MRRFRSAFLSIALTLSVQLLADGFPLKDGRYAGGPTVEVELTTTQQRLVTQHFEPGMVLKLTKGQKQKLKMAAKLKVSPTKLVLFHAPEMANDCTCFAANWAFDFKPGWVEIPIKYLFSDKEAADRQPDPNG
jgi:hypothetical protein